MWWNWNPSCNQFVSAIKTTIINNLSMYYPSYHCEKDNTNYLYTLVQMLNDPCQESSDSNTASLTIPLYVQEFSHISFLNIDKCQMNYRFQFAYF